VGIGIDHDPAGVHLTGHIGDLLGALGNDGIGVILVELLHSDEGAEGLLQSTLFFLVSYLFRHLGGPLGLELDEIRVD